MTPFEINLLLHIYTSPLPPSQEDLPLTQQTLFSFKQNELIIQIDEDEYQVTERGAAHVSQLCALPWPEMAWIDKNGDIISD